MEIASASVRALTPAPRMAAGKAVNVEGRDGCMEENYTQFTVSWQAARPACRAARLGNEFILPCVFLKRQLIRAGIALFMHIPPLFLRFTGSAGGSCGGWRGS